MMKKFKILSMFALSLVLGLSACSSSDDADNQDNKPRSLHIRMFNENDLTRAVGNHVADEELTFKNGFLYLVDNSGVIEKSIEILGKDQQFQDNKVGIKELEKGITVTNLSSAVIKAYVIGNVDNLELPSTPPRTIDEVLSSAVTLETEFDETDKGVKNVTLYGMNALRNSTNPDYDYEVSINVYAASSRFEIGKLEATDGLQYKLEGIFVNNYFNRLGIDGRRLMSGNVTELKDNQSVVDYYQAGYGSYLESLNGIIYDYQKDAQGLGVKVGNSYYPKENDDNMNQAVWAYNFLVADKETASPQIAIRLNVNGATKFISIRQLYKDEQNTTPLVIEKGHVYRLNTIEFDENDLTDQPFSRNDKKVHVDVTLINWVSQDIGYELD